MERYPTIEATRIPTITGAIYRYKSGMASKSNVARSDAASMIGIDIKNENLATVVRSRFRSRPPVIVEPDREIPGKTEIA
jgi:hypothetical protein